MKKMKLGVIKDEERTYSVRTFDEAVKVDNFFCATDMSMRNKTRKLRSELVDSGLFVTFKISQINAESWLYTENDIIHLSSIGKSLIDIPIEICEYNFERLSRMVATECRIFSCERELRDLSYSLVLKVEEINGVREL